MLNAITKRGFKHIVLDAEIFLNKVGWKLVIRQDPPNFCRCQHNCLGFLAGKKFLCRCLIGKIEFGARSGQDLSELTFLQATVNGRTR